MDYAPSARKTRKVNDKKRTEIGKNIEISAISRVPQMKHKKKGQKIVEKDRDRVKTDS